MYININICIYIYTYTYIHIYISQTYILELMHVCKQACMHICVYRDTFVTTRGQVCRVHASISSK